MVEARDGEGDDKDGVAVIVLLLLAIGGGALVWKARHNTHDEAIATSQSHARPIVVMQGSAADPVVFAQAGLGRHTLAGRVTFHAKPFAGATVRIVHALTKTSVGETRSANDGTFAFAGLTADAFVVAARRPTRPRCRCTSICARQSSPRSSWR